MSLQNLACIETPKFILRSHPSYEYILSDLLSKQLLIGCPCLWMSVNLNIWSYLLVSWQLYALLTPIPFLGKKDIVRCFSCGGCMEKWVEGDDPIEDHTKFFPKWAKWLLLTVNEPQLLFPHSPCLTCGWSLPTLLFPLWRTQPMSSALASHGILCVQCLPLHSYILVLVGSIYKLLKTGHLYVAEYHRNVIHPR